MSDNTPDTRDTIRQALEQELDLMRQVADMNADEAIKARAERDEYRAVADKFAGDVQEAHQRWIALQAKLDAKDTEIARWRKHSDDFEAIAKHLRSQIAERDATIAKIQRDFEQTDWGARNIELTDQLNYWRELAGTRDNKIQEHAATIARQAEEIKEWNTAALIECNVCGGGGFSGYGTGYDAVCSCSGGYIGRLKPEDLPELMERNKQLRAEIQSLKEPNT